ncbi:hypothetical protein UFOVP814_31 [uncultured Caudovirales phage]|uniref:Uncharacterized protein n=1 Tax=uncultured Caudovirales phage TaxID=2100421 RepID=A0A6J5P0N7_9CAUD|nr:hypothetical protein UFOVP814_31 [uncultured Caudovirales phage]
MLKQILAVGLVMFSGAAFAQKQVDCTKMSPAEVRMVDDVTTTCKKAGKGAGDLRKEAAKEAKALIADTFKDPEGVKFRNLRITESGEFVCGEVNGKNSYGGYTGFKAFYAAWQSSRVNIEGGDRYSNDTFNQLCVFGKTQPLK